MRRTYVLCLFILLTVSIKGQEMDIRQLPPQEMLEYGALFGNLEIVRLAISKGANINFSEKVPLCKVINGANPPSTPEDGNFVQMLASAFGIKIPQRNTYIELLDWLLQNGAKPNVSSDNNQDNIPLLVAVEYRDLEIIRILLDFKADPNSKSQTGITALHILSIPSPFPYPYKNAPEIANLLISKGAKMISDENIQKPLLMARENLGILEESSSPWRDYPFYVELVTSIKRLIEIYSR